MKYSTKARRRQTKPWWVFVLTANTPQYHFVEWLLASSGMSVLSRK
ncbi:MAG: hypothetical protein ACUVV0_14385 [Anaerolineae bacterium]